MASTYRLVDTLNFVLPHVNFFPLTLGSAQQPFIGFCERVAQVMLAPPFKHNWNRNTVDFLTVAGCQTYKNAGAWTANQVYTVGQVIIDSNGNGEKVVVGGTAGGSAPTWSTGLFTTTGDGSSSPQLTWQNTGVLTSIPQITDFAYIEKAVVQDTNNSNEWKTLNVSLDLTRDTITSCPKYVAAETDDNLGDIALRLTPTPGAIYPVSVKYQKLHTPFTSLASPWAPFPDRLFYVYSMGVLALAYLYKGDMRFQWASQQFVTGMLSYYEGLDQTQINAFLQNWQGTIADNIRTQQAGQGTAARGQ